PSPAFPHKSNIGLLDPAWQRQAGKGAVAMQYSVLNAGIGNELSVLRRRIGVLVKLGFEEPPGLVDSAFRLPLQAVIENSHHAVEHIAECLDREFLGHDVSKKQTAWLDNTRHFGDDDIDIPKVFQKTKTQEHVER